MNLEAASGTLDFLFAEADNERAQGQLREWIGTHSEYDRMVGQFRYATFSAIDFACRKSSK